MYVAVIGIVMNLRFRRAECFLNAGNSRQRFIFDFDCQSCGVRDVLGHRCNCGQCIANESNRIDCQRMFIFRYRQDAELVR